MSKIIKRILSVFLCLSFAVQLNLFSGAVSKDIGSVEIKDSILTATLYVEGLAEESKFGYNTDHGNNENVSTAAWSVIFSDGSNFFRIGTLIMNSQFQSQDEKLTFSQGKNQLWIRTDVGHWRSIAFIVTAILEDHTITWTCDISDIISGGEAVEIHEDSLSILNCQISCANPRYYYESNPNWSREDKSSIDSYFKSVSEKPKYTRLAESCPSTEAEKNAFVDALLINELGSIKGTDKETTIRKKIYNLLFTAQYRPTEFGGKKDEIKKWPYQNSGSNGTRVTDEGLSETVRWSYSCRGCRSYACFASQYVNESNGSIDSNKTGCKADNPADIKKLIQSYADPGEAIHYDYTNSSGNKSNHVVAYVGCDFYGFYFLSYEGGKSKSGTWHILHLEYVTYERLAQSCKSYKIYVWDTNGGTYKLNKAYTLPVITDVKVTVDKTAAGIGAIGATTGITITYSDHSEYIPGIQKAKVVANADDSVEMHFKHNEYNTIQITADGGGAIDYTVEYLTADGVFSTREFKNVPIDENKTITSNVCNCYDQGYLEITDKKTGEASYWSCGINETATAPEPEPDYDTDIADYDSDSISVQILTPSRQKIKWREKLVLHAEVSDIPAGARLVWNTDNASVASIDSEGSPCTVSSHRSDCSTCRITGEGKGTTKITCTVCDASGTPITIDGKNVSASLDLKVRKNFLMVIFLPIYSLFCKQYAY